MKKKVLSFIITICLCVSTFGVMVYADEAKEDGNKNSVEAEEWPELAGADLTDDDILGIYNDYEKAWETYPEDIDEGTAYEEQVAKEVAEKYSVTVDIADLAYMYAVTNYDKLVGAGGTDKEYKIEHGEFVSANGTGSTIVIKVKIEPSLTNKMTIEQNYYNVCDLIREQGLDKYEEIQYWAVADMTDGSEGKVISFTVPKDVIDYIAKNDFPDNMLGDYVEDLWILPGLQK